MRALAKVTAIRERDIYQQEQQENQRHLQQQQQRSSVDNPNHPMKTTDGDLSRFGSLATVLKKRKISPNWLGKTIYKRVIASIPFLQS